LVYFTAILVYFVAICTFYGYLVYFSRFGMFHQEKSGNPVKKAFPHPSPVAEIKKKQFYRNWLHNYLPMIPNAFFTSTILMERGLYMPTFKGPYGRWQFT
jgi:hypothetical protein